MLSPIKFPYPHSISSSTSCNGACILFYVYLSRARTKLYRTCLSVSLYNSIQPCKQASSSGFPSVCRASNNIRSVPKRFIFGHWKLEDRYWDECKIQFNVSQTYEIKLNRFSDVCRVMYVALNVSAVIIGDILEVCKACPCPSRIELDKRYTAKTSSTVTSAKNASKPFIRNEI